MWLFFLLSIEHVCDRRRFPANGWCASDTSSVRHAPVRSRWVGTRPLIGVLGWWRESLRRPSYLWGLNAWVWRSMRYFEIAHEVLKRAKSNIILKSMKRLIRLTFCKFNWNQKNRAKSRLAVLTSPCLIMCEKGVRMPPERGRLQKCKFCFSDPWRREILMQNEKQTPRGSAFDRRDLLKGGAIIAAGAFAASALSGCSPKESGTGGVVRRRPGGRELRGLRHRRPDHRRRTVRNERRAGGD